MCVCFFGFYDPHYSRARVLAEGFRQNGYEIVSSRVEARAHGRVGKFLALWREGRKYKKERFDYVVVMFPGHNVVWLARILFGRRIIFDAFVSLYNSEIEDRYTYSTRHIKAWYYALLDKAACALADTILLDTDTHIAYFVEVIGVNPQKCRRLFVSTTQDIFHSLPHREHEGVRVHFHGSGIPLQGIATIIEAARIVVSKTNIFFLLVGPKDYIQKQGGEDLPPNIEVVGRVALPELNEYINNADIVLGIFGNTKKAAMVIPNKVYEGLAVGKPIITADTPAMRELEHVGETGIVYVPAEDPVALADAIVDLAPNHHEREERGEKGYAVFTQHLLPRYLVQGLLESLAPRHEK